MASIEDLKNLNTPAPKDFHPGIHWDGNTGHVTVATQGERPTPEVVNGVLDTSPFLNSSEVEVDWSASPKVSIHHDDAGNLKQAWYKLPLRKKLNRAFNVDELVERIHTPYHVTTTNPTWRTILITDQHIGKHEQAGGGSEKIAAQWLNSVGKALEGTYDGINLAFGGDIIEGVVSQGGRNITQMDLTLTEQIRVAQHLVQKQSNYVWNTPTT